MTYPRTLGVEHIGLGVSEIEASRSFYADLGFTEVAFEYSGSLPGMERVAGRAGVEARILVLRNPRATALGLGSIKLVHVTDEAVPPMPEGMAWGEPGVCEICVHVRDQASFYRWLTEERSCKSLMEPVEADLTPDDVPVSLSYVADPDEGKIELIEWPSLDAGWPGESGPQGVNHVAFGVASIERSRDFWAALGFKASLFESDGYFEPMHPWYPGPAPRQRMMLLMNPRGAGLEPVEHIPPSPDMRGDWGHLGPMEFGVGVSNLDLAVAGLRSEGVELLCDPQALEAEDGGVLRYAYFVDPDGLFVYLTEARY